MNCATHPEYGASAWEALRVIESVHDCSILDNFVRSPPVIYNVFYGFIWFSKHYLKHELYQI